MTHSTAWFLWLGAALLIVGNTRNPLYLILLLMAFGLTARAARREEALAPIPVAPERFALVAVPLAAIFNALIAHVGSTVLFRLPPAWPLIGGPITAEALVYGATSGLVLATLFAAFTTVNLAVPVRDWVRLVPRGLYPLAVVLSIAVTFVPETLRQVAQVREAQIVRGHRMRRPRDWLPLLMPVLIGGLERAFQLAEALTARGFGARPPGAVAHGHDTVTQIGTLASLSLLLVGGLLALAWDLALWGTGLTVAGGLALLWVLWRTGRAMQCTHYRRRRWTRRDTLVVIGAVLAAGSVLAANVISEPYSAYPALTPPPFNIAVGLALMGMLTPLVGLLAPATDDARTGDAPQAEPPASPARPAPTSASINLERVTYTYPVADRPAIEDVTLHVPAGAFALVVGPSGSGKSTLLRCLNGLVPHFSGGVLRGRIEVGGLDPVAVTPRAMSRAVGFVFQDPEAQFVMDRVEDEVAFALENAGMPRAEMQSRVDEALAWTGLLDLRDRPLATLSGGEKQRVALAAALALRPRILLLDEPTSQLDPESAAEVLNVLSQLNRERGITVLLVEHRLDRVLAFADWVIRVPGDGPVTSGPLVEQLGELEVVPPVVALGREMGWSPRPLTVAQARVFRGPVEPVIVTASSGSAPKTAPYLAARGLVAGYGEREVLRGIDLALHPGEVLALVGVNGAGKSTLLRSLVGLLPLRAGEVRLQGEPLGALPPQVVYRRVGYLPQNPNALLFADTVLDELRITLRNHGLAEARASITLRNHGLAEARAPIAPDALLARLGLLAQADAYPRDLSVGERQRTALGALLVTQPGALLLDEPTRGLDARAKTDLVRLLRSWRDQGLAVLLVTHDVELVAQAADRLAVLEDGQIVARGAPAAVVRAHPQFAPQIAQLFPGTAWMTVEDVRLS